MRVESLEPKDGFVYFRQGLGCSSYPNCLNCPFPDCNWMPGAKNKGRNYIKESDWLKERLSAY